MSADLSVLLITGGHDLLSVTESAGAVKDDHYGMNKPVLRKQLIYNECISFSCVTSEVLGAGASDLSEAKRVHSEGFVKFLETAWDRWESSVRDGTADTYFGAACDRKSVSVSSFVPAQIAPRDPYQRPGPTVFGQCCFYAMDRLTPITERTLPALLNDIAVCKASVDAIVSKKAHRVYALTTEPGHHSGHQSFGGYCYINNSAVIGHMLLEHFDKIGHLDIDYHSGNGSMAIWYDNPRVFFASIHCDCDLDYPYNCGFADQTGVGAGEGTTLNIPLGKSTSWLQYEPALTKCINTMRQWGAQCLVVSLGVDTLAMDPECAPLAGFDIQMEDFSKMGQLIRSLNVPTIYVQEGGYRLDVAAQAVRRVLVG